MALSRQETSPTNSGRVNQKARTRAALLSAAVELVRDGRAPSVPDAAERALVSTATAYRYFPSAEDLWREAAFEAIDFIETSSEVDQAVEAAGDDVRARLDAVITSIGWRMFDEQVPFRHLAKIGIDRWFEQQSTPASEWTPVRQGRRNRWNAMVVEPLRGTLTDDEIDRLVAALGVVWGTEAMISLVDICGVDVETAKQTMRQVCHWVLAGALAGAANGSSAG